MNRNLTLKFAGTIALLALALLYGGLALAQSQTEEGQPYVIQADDSLWKIAQKYLGDGNRYPEIVAATQSRHTADPSFDALPNPNVIRAGSKIWIPGGGAAIAPSLPESPAAPVVAPAQPAPAGASTAPAPALPAGLPDGYIAFSFWNNSPERCTYEINVISVPACLSDAGACQNSRRIFGLNNASEPALSPDGSRLAFRGWGAIPEKYKDDTLDHPYYGCPGPHAERQLGHTTPDATDYYRLGGYYEDSHPDWSPDGSRLLFDTARLGDGITRIVAISADGQREETLRLAGQHPSWAPDNDRFVYRGCDLTGNHCGLWLARALPVEAWDVGTNLLGPVLEEPEAAHPDWSPVGDEIVFQSPAGGSWDLYAIKADGSGRRQLTSDPAIEGLPAWSPDGRWVAYLSDKGGNWGIWLTAADGSGEPVRLFAFDGGNFSPKAIPPYGGRDWIDEQISWSR
ncbi:MAG: hypothetical protein Kow0031_33070 [Anaerolineae bacterium]